MEKVDWNKYRGYKADFIHPKNREAGWQYDAEVMGVDPVLFEGIESVTLKDKEGNYILIPIELANTLIVLYAKEKSSNLSDKWS